MGQEGIPWIQLVVSPTGGSTGQEGCRGSSWLCPLKSGQWGRWYWRAANLGDAQAMYNLGCCYCEGLGVPEDTDKVSFSHTHKLSLALASSH